MAPSRMKIERILCPIDFSEFSERALAQAVRIARWFEASVTAVHVIPTPLWVVSADPGVPYAVPADLLRVQREETAEALEGFVAPSPREGVVRSLAAARRRPFAGDPGGRPRAARRPRGHGHARSQRLRAPAPRIGRGEGAAPRDLPGADRGHAAPHLPTAAPCSAGSSAPWTSPKPRVGRSRPRCPSPRRTWLG